MTIEPSQIIGGACAIVVAIPVIFAILHGHKPRDEHGQLHPHARKTLRKFEIDRARIEHENRKFNKRSKRA